MTVVSLIAALAIGASPVSAPVVNHNLHHHHKTAWDCNGHRGGKKWTARENRCVIRREFHRTSIRKQALEIADCESGYDEEARNPSGASGLFQFLPSTFDNTPYRGKNIFNPVWNAEAAKWLHKQDGDWHEWVCRYLL